MGTPSGVILAGPLRSTFVRVDKQILDGMGQVTEVDTTLGKGLQGLVKLVALTWRICTLLPSHSILYCWFADYHSLIPTLCARLIGRKVIVVAGGYDVGYLPELQYGARVRPMRWFFVRNTFYYASVVLPVSDYALRQLRMLTGGRHARAVVVYNAVLLDRLPMYDASPEKERTTIVTVSQGSTSAEYYRKGSDRFISIAAALPHQRFLLIGLSDAALRLAREAGKNIKNLTIIPGFVSHAEVVVPAYKEASMYLQLSIEETFGVAVAEAMVCGCIPIVSPGGALPEVVGDTGVIAETDEDILAAIAENFSALPAKRLLCAQRGSEFAPKRRALTISKIIADL